VNNLQKIGLFCLLEPLLDLGKYSLNELINILQIFANDPSLSVHQTGFGSYIASYVLKEKIQCYNNESMIPPKLGLYGSKNTYCCRKRVTSCFLKIGININILFKKLYD
jgi:hypothetical protein